MPELSPGVVVLLALGLVVLVNGILLLTVAKSGTRQQIRMLRKAAKRARDPWEPEQQALSELRQRIEELTAREEGEDRHNDE